MGLFDFLKRKNNQKSSSAKFKEQNNLSYIEKERITVKRVKLSDMQQFTELPYQWNRKIEKSIRPHGHPFAYMDLYGPNIHIAKAELQKINAIIFDSQNLSKSVPDGIYIPIDQIMLRPLEDQGHTRIICAPYTFEGNISKYPATLSFMTDLNSDIASTHGELCYGRSGDIEKATIYFWRKKKGYFFYFDTVGGNLVLSKVELSDTTYGYSPPAIIYKGKHILETEARRAAEELDFAWLQKNLSAKCPKSLSGYRRMKTQNTKNYQILKQMAAELGREI